MLFSGQWKEEGSEEEKQEGKKQEGRERNTDIIKTYYLTGCILCIST